MNVNQFRSKRKFWTTISHSVIFFFFFDPNILRFFFLRCDNENWPIFDIFLLFSTIYISIMCPNSLQFISYRSMFTEKRMYFDIMD